MVPYSVRVGDLRFIPPLGFTKTITEGYRHKKRGKGLTRFIADIEILLTVEIDDSQAEYFMQGRPLDVSYTHCGKTRKMLCTEILRKNAYGWTATLRLVLAS
jgi:hypothetical protein